MKKILQIMPADEGWLAAYVHRGDDGSVEVSTEPLLGWALYEEEDHMKPGRFFRHVGCLDAVGGEIDLCDENSNFVGYLMPGRTVDYLSEQAEWVLQRKEQKLEYDCRN